LKDEAHPLKAVGAKIIKHLEEVNPSLGNLAPLFHAAPKKEALMVCLIKKTKKDLIKIDNRGAHGIFDLVRCTCPLLQLHFYKNFLRLTP
jgi:hypothetical protein